MEIQAPQLMTVTFCQPHQGVNTCWSHSQRRSSSIQLESVQQRISVMPALIDARIIASMWSNRSWRKEELPQFENREVEIAVTGNQFIDTSADLHGFMREHKVQSEVQEVRITLTQEKQHGVTLKELEFIVAE